jgi:soluble cytochrome b562
MHGAVLQNEDYIDFAEESSVEVISLSRLDEGVSKEDRKAGQYDAEDAEGNPVKYMVEFPNLTLEEMYALNRSKAGTYNQTGKIPYTAIVDPHTEEELQGISGGQSAKQLMEIVAAHKKTLEEKHGPSLSRKDVRAVEECKVECNELLKEKGAGKALTQLAKDGKKLEKKGERIAAMVEEYRKELMEKAGEELDQADQLIGEGDVSAAKKILSSLKSAVKKTDLEERVNALYEKIKAAAAE